MTKNSNTTSSNSKNNQSSQVLRTYKDSVFRLLFNDKEKLIELYNAIYDTDYTMDTPLDFETIEDVIFMTLKNDIAFTLNDKFIVIMEHQSSVNNNMPLRDLFYISTILQRMIDSSELYKEALYKIPRPQFIVFYNGKTHMPAYSEFKLSDAFKGDENDEISLQLVVKVYNINSEVNGEILKKSRTLYEYSRFVSIMREYYDKGPLTNEVMREILNKCIAENILADFLKKYGSEVIGMLFKELTEEEVIKISEEGGYEKGKLEGLTEGKLEGLTVGEQKAKKEAALTMLRKGYDVKEISEIIGLTEDEVEQLK
ncbi:MAG TPA: hypothetical protein VJY37_00965 [Anaerovoracaceae bacterium]|nr:hypothetical protein [Anaerovoracaceae bacterium]